MNTRALLKSILARFAMDDRGNVALVTGLLAVPLIGAVGAGIDYTRLVSYRLKMDSAATTASLAAISTARAMLLSNPQIAPGTLNEAARARAQQVFAGLAPSEAAGTVLFSRVGDTLSSQVQYSGTVKTTFMGIFNMPTMTAGGASSSNGQIGAMPGVSDPSILVEENFNVAGVQADKNYGSFGLYKDFNNWKTNNVALEIGRAGTYGVAPPNNAAYIAELDDGNIFMARKIYLTPGSYELRYYYRDRITDANYAPVQICGPSAADVAWSKTETRAPWNVKLSEQTNLISVFLELANTDTPPAAFTPAEHTEVDACVLSSGRWIERSIKIKTYAAGFYWLAFQSQGETDGAGGLLSGIRFCINACPGAVLESFPWTAGQTLFSDNFERQTGDPNMNWQERTLDNSGTNLGWTNLPTGWTTFPTNQIDFQTLSDGTYHVELDSTTYSGTESSNRGIARRFLLMPGYYQLKFTYRSFGFTPSYNLCDMNEGPNIALLGSTDTEKRFNPSTMNMQVFMDADLLVSHPYSDPVLRAPASWFNPDDKPATLTRLPFNRLASCISAVGQLDKTINMMIRKTGFYWLTFRGWGTADNHGGAIDDVTLKVLGPRSMARPADTVNIPFSGTESGATIKKRHLEYIAN